MPKNIKFIYLYRDSSNFKDWGKVIFLNNKYNDISDASKEIIKYLDLGVSFIAEKVSIPTLDLYREDFQQWNGLSFHEYSSIEFTEENPTDVHNRDFSVFIGDLKKCAF